MKNSEINLVLMKILIMHATTKKITVTKRYMHLLHVSSGNDQCPSKHFGDSSKLTNWILDSGATCHMIPEVSDFIPGLLEDTDKYIEVAYIHHVTVKQKG